MYVKPCKMSRLAKQWQSRPHNGIADTYGESTSGEPKLHEMNKTKSSSGSSSSELQTRTSWIDAFTALSAIKKVSILCGYPKQLKNLILLYVYSHSIFSENMCTWKVGKNTSPTFHRLTLEPLFMYSHHSTVVVLIFQYTYIVQRSHVLLK